MDILAAKINLAGLECILVKLTKLLVTTNQADAANIYHSINLDNLEEY